MPFEEAYGRRVEKAIGELKVTMASIDDLIMGTSKNSHFVIPAFLEVPL